MRVTSSSLNRVFFLSFVTYDLIVCFLVPQIYFLSRAPLISVLDYTHSFLWLNTLLPVSSSNIGRISSIMFDSWAMQSLNCFSLSSYLFPSVDVSIDVKNWQDSKIHFANYPLQCNVVWIIGYQLERKHIFVCGDNHPFYIKFKILKSWKIKSFRICM